VPLPNSSRLFYGITSFSFPSGAFQASLLRHTWSGQKNTGTTYEQDLVRAVILGSLLIPSGSGSFLLFFDFVSIIYTAGPLTFFLLYIYLFLPSFFFLILTFCL